MKNHNNKIQQGEVTHYFEDEKLYLQCTKVETMKRSATDYSIDTDALQ